MSAASIALSPGALSYAEHRGTAAIDSFVAVSDTNSSTLIGATIQLLGYVPGQDQLSFINQPAISGSWDPSTGILTLTGVAPVTAYQAALRIVSYKNISSDPNTAFRAAQFIVSDGSSDSAPAVRGIQVVAINNAPTLPFSPTQQIAANASLVFSASAGNAISVADVDANNGIEQLTLTATGGSLRLGHAAGLAVISRQSAGTLTIDGTINALNNALDGLRFIPASPSADAGSLQLQIDDLGNTGSGGPLTANALVPIQVNSVEDATSLAIAATSAGPATTLAANAAPPPPIILATIPSPADASPAEEKSAGGILDAQMKQQPVVTFARNVPRPFGNATRAMFSAAQINATLIPVITTVASAHPATTFAVAPHVMPMRQRSNPSAPKEHSINFHSDITGAMFSFTSSGMLRELDAMHRALTSQVPLRVWAGSASVLSAGLSLAYFLWLTRGGSLLSSLLSSMPAWKLVDPLPILDHMASSAAMVNRSDDDGLDKLIGKAGGV